MLGEEGETKDTGPAGNAIRAISVRVESVWLEEMDRAARHLSSYPVVSGLGETNRGYGEMNRAGGGRRGPRGTVVTRGADGVKTMYRWAI